MATTPLQSWPIPSLTDLPNGPAQFQALGNAAERQSVLQFPDRTTRDAKVQNPDEGMMCWVDDRKTMLWYGNGVWNTFTKIHSSSGGIGSGPAPDVGLNVTHVANYGEQATGSDGKFTINFPSGFTRLVSLQVMSANRGVANLVVVWVPTILTAGTSGSSAHIHAHDLDGTIVNSKFVGYTYHAILQ